MNQTLYYLSGFNNYYNRQVKKPQSTLISDYDEWIVVTTAPTSFNPNDNVNTAIDVNYDGLDDNVDLDYLLVSEDNITISSRWFVLDRKRNLSGQWNVSLRRDLFSDYYNDIINSPVFIEKAPLLLSNKLIFNKENGINYNQIKTGEELLMDETRCGWLVGYLADNHEEKTITVSSSDTSYPAPLIDLATIQSYNSPWKFQESHTVLTYIGSRYGTTPVTWWVSIYDTGNVGTKLISGETDTYEKFWGGTGHPNGEDIHTAGDALAEQARLTGSSTIRDAVKTLYSSTISGTYIDDETLEKLNVMSGGIYTDTVTGQTFRITVTVTKGSAVTELSVTQSSGALFTLMDTMWDNAKVGGYAGGPVPSYYAKAYTNKINIAIETVNQGASAVIKTTTNKLQDAPYKMFCVPLSDELTITAQYQIPGETGQIQGTFLNNANIAKRIATEIATQYGGLGGTTSFIYDLQLLPYCPIRNLIDPTVYIATVDVTYGAENVDFTPVFIGNSGIPSTVIFWATESNFSFTINKEINVPTNIIDFKIDNETKFVRLCSPNYSGTFEFKPTMNYGVSSWEVNCTYKPYQPYIHISPIFNDNGLYGGNYIDQRGLVCTGDFSVPVKNDAWINYQIQNKSYSDSFNRQIENMSRTFDIQQEQARKGGIINAITAGISAGAAGGMIGGNLGGGPIGAGAGLATGLATGLLGGALSMYGLKEDLKYAQQLHDESLSFAKDQFGYQLQNIEALPYTLGKVGSFNINNKIFPFIEFYDASEEEREAIREKLIYNGFTVMTTGKLIDYLINTTLPEGQSFVQGQLIRYIGDNMDYHEAVELASELHKGVYI